jgi:hypothetical protein
MSSDMGFVVLIIIAYSLSVFYLLNKDADKTVLQGYKYSGIRKSTIMFIAVLSTIIYNGEKCKHY